MLHTQRITILKDHHDIIVSDQQLTPKLKNKAFKVLSLCYSQQHNLKGSHLWSLAEELSMNNNDTIKLINYLVSIKLLNRGRSYNVEYGNSKSLTLNMVRSEDGIEPVDYYSEETITAIYTYKTYKPRKNKQTVALDAPVQEIKPEVKQPRVVKLQDEWDYLAKKELDYVLWHEGYDDVKFEDTISTIQKYKSDEDDQFIEGNFKYKKKKVAPLLVMEF